MNSKKYKKIWGWVYYANPIPSFNHISQSLRQCSHAHFDNFLKQLTSPLCAVYIEGCTSPNMVKDLQIFGARQLTRRRKFSHITISWECRKIHCEFFRVLNFLNSGIVDFLFALPRSSRSTPFLLKNIQRKGKGLCKINLRNQNIFLSILAFT